MTFVRRPAAGAALGLLGAAAVSSIALAPVPADVPAVLYVLIVAAAAAVGGAAAGAVATVASIVAFTYLFTPPLHSFEIVGVSDAVTLAAFVVTAAGVSRLIAHERSARCAAEAARHEAAEAAARSARLQAVTALLARALTREEMADLVIEHAVAALGASVGLVALLDEERGTLRTIRLVGAPLDGARTWQEFALDLPTPVGDAIRAGTPIWFSSLRERNARYPDLQPYEGEGAIAAIPLIVDGRRLGGLVLLSRRRGAFGDDDRHFALALAGLCAQAFERARPSSASGMRGSRRSAHASSWSGRSAVSASSSRTRRTRSARRSR